MVRSRIPTRAGRYIIASGDAKAGDTKGDAFGNLWAIGKAGYTVMLGNAQWVGLDGAQYNDQTLAGACASSFITMLTAAHYINLPGIPHATNTFTKADLSNDTVWPMDKVTTIGSIPTALDKTQFTLITTFGISQLTYKGYPLYYFGQDAGVRAAQRALVSQPRGGHLEDK